MGHVAGHVGGCAGGRGGLTSGMVLSGVLLVVGLALLVRGADWLVDGGSRLFLFPQCYQARVSAGAVPEWILNTGVNPAAFEISGHLLMKTRDDFDALDEDKACRMLEQVSLDEGDFLEVVRMCLG